jgi:hypothetical protein
MTSGSCRRALRSACEKDRDLALVDDRLIVAVEILDRILDRHDVRRACRVDLVDHRRQRRRLPAARRACDEHEPAFLHRNLLQDGGEPQLVDVADAERDDTEDQSDGSALLEYIAAEAAQSGDAVRKIHFLSLAEALEMLGLEDDAGHLLRVSALETFFLGRDDQRPVDPHHRIAADFQVQIGRTARDSGLEEIVDVH